jgi:hypothetical protein
MCDPRRADLEALGVRSDQRNVLIKRFFKNEASSNRSKKGSVVRVRPDCGF